MKTIWIVLISLFAGALVVGGCTYYFVSVKSTKEKDNLQAQINDLNTKYNDSQVASSSISASQNATPGDTSSWKTYSSTKDNYSIKYPSNWFIYGADDTVYIQDYQEPNPDVVESHGRAFQITVTTVASATSLDTVISQIEHSPFAEIAYDKTPLTIDGQPAYRMISTCDGAGCGAPEWIVMKNNAVDSTAKEFDFTSNLGYTGTFDMILSTFKFSN